MTGRESREQLASVGSARETEAPLRIVVVSAHYPPNFVSGGTLQPQRLSRGLRALGHDVRVFAGHLNDRLPPLKEWEDKDESGLPIRWIVTTPWTNWEDRRNYDNPAVETAFRRYLDLVRPDVVHLHSLQTLGAGLVRASANSGAQVIVTMHDFWWLCARQFLVDRSFRPCCPVVVAGTCECETGRSDLDERSQYLRGIIDAADMVLAPSRIAAEVMAANGVAPGRLRVDENGVEAQEVTRAQGGRGGHGGGLVRLLYAGGPHQMKGVHVLWEALSRLADLSGWELVAYGAAPPDAPRPAELSGLPVKIAPPFHPDEADTVFSRADGLVIPSVMRETYSILTRDALTRSVPVITTDSLGPEEVVEHGDNGLVVPAADPQALSDALRRFITDAPLRARLRSGCRGIRTRTINEQVSGLDALYRELAVPTRRPSSPAPRRAVGSVLFACGIEGAPLRYRARLPAEALGLLGIRSDVRHFRDPALPDLLKDVGALVLYRVPATPAVLSLIDRARDKGIPIVFDVDDLIFDPSIAEDIPALQLLPPEEAALWMEGVKRYRTTMQEADLYIGSTETLVEHASRVVGLPAERFANGVGVVGGRLADAALARNRSQGPPRIGYFSGTTTHDLDWLLIEEPVLDVLRTYPDTELWLGGHVPKSARLSHLGDRLRIIPYQPWDSLWQTLRDLDVNLAPLTPGLFNEAKSAIKWLEAALVGTPTVASPTQPFREVVRQDETGLLASTPDEWSDAIGHLLEDATAARHIGSRARREALLRWSPWRQAERYADILDRATELARNPSRAANRIPPVTRDDPPTALDLEPYERAPHVLRADAETPLELTAERPIRFALRASAGVPSRIDLRVATYSGPGTSLSVSVRDIPSGLCLARANLAASRVRDNEWAAFDLQATSSFLPIGPLGLLVTVRPGAGTSGRIALWGRRLGHHLHGLRTRPGTPCVRVWGPILYDRPTRPQVGGTASRAASLWASLHEEGLYLTLRRTATRFRQAWRRNRTLRCRLGSRARRHK